MASIDRLLEPRSVAVVGASTSGTAQANQYIRNLRAYGYEGSIYAVHPHATTIDGLPALLEAAAEEVETRAEEALPADGAARDIRHKDIKHIIIGFRLVRE